MTPRAPRPGFTLIEVALASVIGAVVLIAAMSLIMTLERTQRAVSTRANEAAQLQRARLVMQRAFGSILVSSPAPQRTTVAVATPTDSAAPAQGSAGTARELPASSRGRRAPGETPDRGPGSRGSARSPATGGSHAAPDGTQSSGASDNQASQQPMIRPPEDAAPRIILHQDDLVSQYAMNVREADGTLTPTAPQRLEMVLIEPPVPTQQQDPFVLARAVRLEAKRRGISHERPGEDGAADTAPEGDAAAPDPNAEPSEDWGIRAVRGAFELIPKEDRAGRVPFDASGNPLAWELWWVPLAPRRTIEEVRDMGRAQAVLEASSYGEPFRIATDLAACRFRMFDDRVRKDAFQATIANQLPAYVEVDISTIGGLTASWLFEVSWATGPETRPRVDENAAPSDVVGGRTVENLQGTRGDGKGGPQSPTARPVEPPKSPATPRPSGVSRTQPVKVKDPRR